SCFEVFYFSFMLKWSVQVHGTDADTWNDWNDRRRRGNRFVPPQKKMECDKNKGAFGRVWTRRMPLSVYSFLCTAYLKIGFESNIL
ncbi:hypothetical protein, partial [Bacteroides acidifaciens]|uniref:hypothetical protein n=1 Tax=Bacteroides acidifaciens TaxID=85831 RepID=UPI0025A547B8